MTTTNTQTELAQQAGRIAKIRAQAESDRREGFEHAAAAGFREAARFTVEAGDGVRVKNSVPEFAGRRGVAVVRVGAIAPGGAIWQCRIEPNVSADFNESELTVLEKGVAK